MRLSHIDCKTCLFNILAMQGLTEAVSLGKARHGFSCDMNMSEKNWSKTYLVYFYVVLFQCKNFAMVLNVFWCFVL